MKLEDFEKSSFAIYDLKSQWRDHIFSRSVDAHAMGDKARDEIDSIEKLEAHNSYMRGKFLEGMGGLPPMDTPLNAQRTGVIKCDGFIVENIIFESRKDTPVTGNLYVPDEVIEPQGAVLHVLGHSPDAKFRDVYQMVCQYLVRAGLVVFVFDPIGQGERYSYYDPRTRKTTVNPGTSDHEQGGAQCWPLGQWETRYFLHDVMRALDYMGTRPEIDPNRIGITGVSGGGMQTLLAMLCDSRIAAAAPACYTTSREAKMYSGFSQDAEQIWTGMSALGFDHEDFLLAFASKPLLLLTATGDFFPIEGTHKTISRSRRFWEWFGKGNDLQQFEEDCRHSYTVSMAKEAAVFFAKHLLNREVSVEDAEIKLLEPAQLQCTQSGQVRGDYPNARFVYEENCDYLNELERRRALLPAKERDKTAKEWLRNKVFAARRLGDGRLNPRYPFDAEQVEEEHMYAQNVFWKSQERLFNHAIILRDVSHTVEKNLPVTVAIWEGGTTKLSSHIKWIREVCAMRRMVMVLDLTGSGPLSPFLRPNHKMRQTQRLGMTHKLTMDLFWINDSLAAIRVLDVIRALDMAESLRGARSGELQIYTKGRYSIYPQLAAILDRRLKHLHVEQGMGPLAEWVRSQHYETDDVSSLLLPGMLQYLDIE